MSFEIVQMKASVGFGPKNSKHAQSFDSENFDSPLQRIVLHAIQLHASSCVDTLEMWIRVDIATMRTELEHEENQTFVSPFLLIHIVYERISVVLQRQLPKSGAMVHTPFETELRFDFDIVSNDTMLRQFQAILHPRHYYSQHSRELKAIAVVCSLTVRSTIPRTL